MSDDVDRTEVMNYVERFATMLIEAGMQRMTARVFSYILIDDASSYTAAELSEGMGVSLAAVSNAVRDLVTGGLIIKSRRPDTRADVYEILDDDIWGRIMLDRVPLLKRYRDLALSGLEVLPPGAGRDRMFQSAMFFEFASEAFSEIRERWDDYRERMSAAPDSDRGESRAQRTGRPGS
ncbi:GbsR/MarR family transcriptional regulator [Glycomyces xiaoerkulensis]|uniref:GbsR/MarR family transcriptional regulator n=1 Tax=Glycomyces xiaoerkulensis TaxID=2038139 RepID=UPI000C26B5F5|nr:helix-turn-helix domain-containing protein [Glycomyces xiaoerkulensis]